MQRLSRTTLHASSNLLSFGIGLCPLLGSHLGGTFVDLSRETLGQILQPVFVRTL